MLGVKAVVPNGDLSSRRCATRSCSVGAGDNVVRLLPPLIVTDEVDDPRGGSSASAPALRRRKGGRVNWPVRRTDE
jgi:acetylornithine/N-succinyldiaminopimelate aminotransferase